MATFVLIHGAGDVGWYWHLVEAQLRARGHDVVAPDLPSEDETKGLDETADEVVREIGDRRDLVVVGQSFGGFTAPLIAARLPVKLLVYLAAMVPAPGERPADWWSNTGYGEAAKQQAAKDGGLTGNDDPFICFYNGVPRELAEEALSYERGQSEASQDKAGRSRPTRTCRRSSSCARTTASFPPTCSAGSCPSGWALFRTKSPAATAWRSATPKSWPTNWRAT